MYLFLLFSYLCSFVDLPSPFTHFHLSFPLCLLLLLPPHLNLPPIHDGTTPVAPYHLHAPVAVCWTPYYPTPSPPQTHHQCSVKWLASSPQQYISHCESSSNPAESVPPTTKPSNEERGSEKWGRGKGKTKRKDKLRGRNWLKGKTGLKKFDETDVDWKGWEKK